MINEKEMTIKEAIKDIAEAIEPVVDGKSLELAIEALEKQIVKAVIPYNSGKNHNFIECSVCSSKLDLYYKYCTECGQKLRD